MPVDIRHAYAIHYLGPAEARNFDTVTLAIASTHYGEISLSRRLTRLPRGVAPINFPSAEALASYRV